MTTEGTNDATGEATEEEKVVEAYRRLWVEIVAANDPPNPDSPKLAEVATGEMLRRMKEQVSRNLSDGKGTRFASPSRFRVVPTEVSIVGNEATLKACMADDLVSYRLPDGAPLNEEIVSRQLVAQLRQDDARWRTIENRYIDNKEGVDTCPEQHANEHLQSPSSG